MYAEEGSEKRKAETAVQSMGKRRHVGGPNEPVRDAVPVVQVPDDLGGKRVQHLCTNVTDDGDDEEMDDTLWYTGTVVEMKGGGRNPLFVIRYNWSVEF